MNRRCAERPRSWRHGWRERRHWCFRLKRDASCCGFPSLDTTKARTVAPRHRAATGVRVPGAGQQRGGLGIKLPLKMTTTAMTTSPFRATTAVRAAATATARVTTAMAAVAKIARSSPARSPGQGGGRLAAQLGAAPDGRMLLQRVIYPTSLTAILVLPAGRAARPGPRVDHQPGGLRFWEHEAARVAVPAPQVSEEEEVGSLAGAPGEVAVEAEPEDGAVAEVVGGAVAALPGRPRRFGRLRQPVRRPSTMPERRLCR